MKKISQTQIKKKIKEMTAEEKDALLLSLYQHEPQVLSSYFGDREYREEVIGEFKKSKRHIARLCKA